MKIVYSKDFLKQVGALPTKVQEQLDTLVHILSNDPFYPTLHTKRLKGQLKSMLSLGVVVGVTGTRKKNCGTFLWLM